MATESAFNPLALIAHVVAIAVGIFLGIQAMAAISPDLPSDESDPGVVATAAPGQVAPDDPNSLLQPGPLSIALSTLDDQREAGQKLSLIHITPDQLSSEPSDTDAGFVPDDVDFGAPSRLAGLIAADRPDVRGLADVQFVDLRLDERGEQQWFVQLDSRIDPPRTYVSPADALEVEPGG